MSRRARPARAAPRVFWVCMITALLVGCGQQGPLVLPDRAPASQPTPDASTDAEDTDDEDDGER